jgi:acid stress chaperone HdeB
LNAPRLASNEQQFLEIIMKLAVFACVIATTTAPATAQVTIDMSLLTCKQLLAADPERQTLISSWMAGYFSGSKNLNVVDFRYTERNRKVVGNYCKIHRSDTVMDAMQKNWR